MTYLQKRNVAVLQDNIDRVMMAFGQMNESPGARFGIALTGVTLAEYLQNKNMDVLFFIDNVYRYLQAGTEISTLLGRIPSETGYQPTLASEIADMRQIVENTYRDIKITQDLGLGMMIWMTHFFPDEPWARLQRERSLAILDPMWIDPPGYFCRQPFLSHVKFAFTNYGISVGLQAVGALTERIAPLNAFFESYRSGDEYDTNAITHVMACTSHFPGEFIRENWPEDPAGAGGG